MLSISVHFSWFKKWFYFLSEVMFCGVLQGYWTRTLRNSSPVTIVYIHWARKILLLGVILILSSGIQSLKLQTIPIPKSYTTLMVMNDLGGLNLGSRFPCQLERTLLEEIIIDSRMSCLHSIQAQVNFRCFFALLVIPGRLIQSSYHNL